MIGDCQAVADRRHEQAFPRNAETVEFDSLVVSVAEGI